MTITRGPVWRRVPDDERETTTIQVSVSTWQRLNALKLPGDDFDDVVRRLLDDHERVEDLEAEVQRLESALESGDE